MSNPTVIETKNQLIEYMEIGIKPKDKWRIGTEHEKFVFNRHDLKPLHYDGEISISVLLNELRKQFNWQPIIEKENIIGLEKSRCSMSLEPGGQLELSGAPLENLHQTCDEVHTHLKEVKAVAKHYNVGFLGMGFYPTFTRESFYWMPKERYKIMREYMPKVGNMGIDMMLRTATVQVNLDFSSEADMIKKYRVALALQPLATALFANSPFTMGKPNNYLSYRAKIWQHTDASRTGLLPFVFKSDMSFERYVDYALKIPMYFIKRKDKYINVAGESFKDFLQGKLSSLPKEQPLLSDWENHLTTIFPEVRLKHFLEMRGADAGSWSNLCALPAFWTGLLYDNNSLDQVWSLIESWPPGEVERQYIDCAKYGLKTTYETGTLFDLAEQILDIAEQGLVRRKQLNYFGNDESIFLKHLWSILEKRLTPAEQKLKDYEKEWNKQIEPLFERYAY